MKGSAAAAIFEVKLVESPPPLGEGDIERAALKTANLYNVPIFDEGTWNEQGFTAEQIEGIIRDTNALQTIGELSPFVRVDHDDDNAWANFIRRTGISLGWLKNIRRVGTQVWADFEAVPMMLARLIEAKGFRKVSSELWWNFRDSKGNQYEWVIQAAALLGAKLPAVTTLADVPTKLYQVDEGMVDLVREEFADAALVFALSLGHVGPKQGEEPMTTTAPGSPKPKTNDNEAKPPTESKPAEFSAEARAAIDAANAEARRANERAEALERRENEREVDRFIEKHERRITPALAGYARAALIGCSDEDAAKTGVKFERAKKDGEGTETVEESMTPREALRRLLAGLREEIPDGETAVAGANPDPNADPTGHAVGSDPGNAPGEFSRTPTKKEAVEMARADKTVEEIFKARRGEK